MFEYTLSYHQVHFQYTVKDSIDAREIHPYHEILYYIDGNTTFLCEHFQEKLQPGTLLLIPKESYHCFRREQRDRFLRLKISFPDLAELAPLADRTLTGIKLFKPADNPLLPLLDKMCQTISDGESLERNCLFLYSAFLMLFIELSKEKEGMFLPSFRDTRHLITRCLNYIDENLTGNVRVETIATRLHVSVSTLSHAFKKELGISLHQYIIQKRLINARNLILSGENPTKIFSEYGYRDYSSFYKAYLSFFRCSPSMTK